MKLASLRPLKSATELREWWEKVPPGCMVEVHPSSKFGRSLAALFGSVRAFCRISDRGSAEFPQDTPHERILAALRSKEGRRRAEHGKKKASDLKTTNHARP